MFDTDRVRFLLFVSLLTFLGALGLVSFLMFLLAVEVAVRYRWKQDLKWPIDTFVVGVTILSRRIGAYGCVGMVVLAYEVQVGVVGFCGGGLILFVAIILGAELYRESTHGDYVGNAVDG